jgi:hypothetical protein
MAGKASWKLTNKEYVYFGKKHPKYYITTIDDRSIIFYFMAVLLTSIPTPSTSHIILLKRDFVLNVLYSTLFHLPPIRLHCVGGSRDRSQDSCDFGIDFQTL